MDADELGQLIKKSRSWVYQAVQAGNVPHIRIGGNVRFSRKAIRKWLEKQQAG
ncbi:MAG: helix-turn-helix domain-containing protein [Deltaproteobacteria bacterium]|nr:helix-turn-helix domain-containing protein [Deltaproteobacteria bacterium]